MFREKYSYKKQFEYFMKYILMSYKIIVARYNEDIAWLKPEINNCIFYNKGEKLGITNEIMRPNIGRESETYLQYIIENYPIFPDIVVFTQANISDHRNGGIHHLLTIKKQAENLILLKSYPLIFHFNKIHPNQQCWDEDWNLVNNIWYLDKNYKNNQPILFKNWFQTHIHNIFPNPIIIYPNGIFAVKKELILNHSLDYYKSLILEVNHNINPTEGHFFERSWFYIFH